MDYPLSHSQPLRWLDLRGPLIVKTRVGRWVDQYHPGTIFNMLAPGGFEVDFYTLVDWVVLFGYGKDGGIFEKIV